LRYRNPNGPHGPLFASTPGSILASAEDTQACPGGCSWLYVDYDIGYGICSNCPEVYEEFILRVAGDEDAEAEPRIEVVQDLGELER
jgi:hypothetical protein